MGPIINNKAPMTADEIDACLSKLQPLRFKAADYVHKRMNVSDFIKKFFELNNSCDTINAVTGEVECIGNNKRRSIVDIYQVCKFYYPRTTNIRTLARIFHKFNDQKLLKMLICNEVKRRVIRMVGISNGVIVAGGGTTKDEFGLNFSEFLALKDQE